jgi:hypothetical protein
MHDFDAARCNCSRQLIQSGDAAQHTARCRLCGVGLMMKCVSLLAMMLKLIGWFKQNKMSFFKNSMRSESGCRVQNGVHQRSSFGA